MILAAAIQTSSNSIGMFIGARSSFWLYRHATARLIKSTSRFLIGFGFTFAGSAAPLLITEIAFPSQRGQATSIYNSLWCV